MRTTLIAAVALAPLLFAAGAVDAATTISSNTSTPVATATANKGAADDVTIASGVTVSAAAGTTTPVSLVTVNSSNAVANSGTLSSSNINNVTAIQANAGVTGSVANNAVINLTTTFAPPTSVDGYQQGPFAGTASAANPSGTGDYGLYGIRLSGAGTFTGSITNTTSGTINISGNASRGISLESALSGTLTQAGTVSLVGDANIGVSSTAAGSVSGNVVISGGVTTTGAGSSAVVLNGNVGGQFRLYSTLTSTGYAVSTRTSDPTLLAKLQTAANHQIDLAGSTLVVGGNVAGGLYFSGAPIGTVAGSTADLTGDGLADSSEGTSSIVQAGSAPALVVGAASGNIVIGGFAGLNGATQDNGFGMVMRGAVSAAGVYDNIDANAVWIGTKTGGSANLSSGLRLYGTVNASAYNANATALHVFGGSVVPTTDIRGSVQATIAASTSTVAAGGLIIESGAQVNVLSITGSVIAAGVGDHVSAYAVRDLSGTISSVLNEGAISASNSVTALGDVQTGRAVALDLSANTTGVTLVQKLNPSPQTAYGSTSGTNATGLTTVTATPPVLLGDVLLGSGTNTVSFLSGTMIGGLDMGSGTGGSLTIDNGASVSAALTFTGSGLAVNVANGTLDIRSANTLNLSSLNVGGTSSLYFAADPANLKATQLLSTGPVTIASGAKFGLNLLSLPTTDQTYVVVRAANPAAFSVGTTAVTGGLSTLPYMVSANITSNAAAGTVSLELRRKTAAELNLSTSEASLLNQVYTVAPSDPEVRSVLLAQTSRNPFIRVFDQLLPESSGAVFEAAREASDAVTRATTAHDQSPGAAGTKGLWGEEFVVGAHGNRSDQNIDFDLAGFGVVGGMAYGGSGLGAMGVTAAFSTITVTNPLIKGDSQQAISTIEGGVYWQGSINHLTLDARAALAASSIDGRRQLYSIAQDGTVAVNRRVKDNRNAINYTLHLGGAYEYTLGSGFYVRPQLQLDYFGMNEDGFTETDPVGKGFALTVNSRSGSVGSGSASFVLGRSTGTDFRVRPEFELGVRDAFGGGAGSTTARFVSGGTPFVLNPTDLTGVGGMARFALKVSTDFYEVGLHAGVEVRDHFESGDARVTVRLLF
jgi:Autotransporter beta-domain